MEVSLKERQVRDKEAVRSNVTFASSRALSYTDLGTFMVR